MSKPPDEIMTQRESADEKGQVQRGLYRSLPEVLGDADNGQHCSGPTPGYEMIQGSNLDVLPILEVGVYDSIIADPPYGIEKASWDAYFPRDWFQMARPLLTTNGKSVILTGAGQALAEAIQMLGPLYKATFAAWLCNGMTRGKMSFGNWTAVIIGSDNEEWKPIQDVFRVTIQPGEKVPHPSQKPLELMRQVVRRLTEPGDLILDPFAGSGTTGVACVMEGRRFLGIESNAEYARLAFDRMNKAASTPSLFKKGGMGAGPPAQPGAMSAAV